MEHRVKPRHQPVKHSHGMTPMHVLRAPVEAGGVARHVPGEPGLWVLLLGDMTLFAALFAFYLRRRGESPELFAESQGTLHSTSV